MKSGRHLACPQLCPSLPTLTFITSWAAKPPIKAFMGARSPAATYASFRMRSSSRGSCCTAGKDRAFTACAKVTSSVASSWKGKQNQERTSQANCGERDRERIDGRAGEALGQRCWLACPLIYLIVGPRGPAMLSTEVVQGLEANVQLTWARILGKIRNHKVWLCQ